MIPREITLVLALWILGTVMAQNDCCNGTKNIIGNGHCMDGSIITGITCKRKYVISSTDKYNYTINSQKELVEVDSSPISVDRYCLTTEDENGPTIALVCFTEANKIQVSDSYFLFRAICAMISVIFLIATVIVYISVPSLRDLQGKCLLNITIFLALAMFLLGLMQFGISFPQGICHVIGYVTYMAFIITFTWLNVLSFHIWQKTVVPTLLGTKKQWEFIFYVYGYGIPLILLITALIAHHSSGDHIKPGIGEKGCWFSDSRATWAYFYGPISFFLICNMILFFFTIKKLWNDTKTVTHCAKLKSLRYKCLMYTKLFFVMGLSWIFEVISYAVQNKSDILDYLWMVTDFINVLQGVLIFLILVVFRKRAVRGIAQNGLCCIKLPQQWKTLEDEEISEVTEEQKLAKVCITKEQLSNTNHTMVP